MLESETKHERFFFFFIRTNRVDVSDSSTPLVTFSHPLQLYSNAQGCPRWMAYQFHKKETIII